MAHFEITSGQIVFDCLKEYGKGELFLRTDGLQFEERRARVRLQYLEAHPETAHYNAIENAAVTPGMTRAEVIAAWGLIEEDTRMAFGHVTEERRVAFAYFTGIEVGVRYALYFKGDRLAGVRQTEELVAPHERELDMRFAEQRNSFYFYDGNDGQLRGSNVDQYNMDWDTAHLRLYTVDILPRSSHYRIEYELKKKGVFEEYERVLTELGYQPSTVTAEVQNRIALSLLPYPPLTEADLKKAMPKPAEGEDWRLLPASDFPEIEETPTIPHAPLREAPASTADSNARSLINDETPPPMPPPEWFEYVADGREQQAVFPTADGKVELVNVHWWEELLFVIKQIPLLVNGISYADVVEVEWREGEIIPHFKRVVDSEGERVVRVTAVGSNEKAMNEFLKDHMDRRHLSYRYENNVLVFGIVGPELDEGTRNWLSYLDASWIYTDTLSQT